MGLTALPIGGGSEELRANKPRYLEKCIISVQHSRETRVFLFRFDKSSGDDGAEAAEGDGRAGALQKAVDVRALCRMVLPLCVKLNSSLLVMVTREGYGLLKGLYFYPPESVGGSRAVFLRGSGQLGPTLHLTHK